MFDDGMLTAIGGPHALFALALALAIAGALFLLDHVAPYDAFLPGGADEPGRGLIASGS